MNEHHTKPAPEGAENSPASGGGSAGGAGPDGTIPVSADGISLTTTADGSNYNPEEDPAAGTRPPAPGKLDDDKPDK